ncbi:60S ribosomal protein L38 [Thelotrema lepadinum]|nr:60S ribosomal protein L38 [Thelotrema lepadinum]
MPQEVSDIKRFIEICRRKDASSARIKRNKKTGQIKFKVRGSRYLYTLSLKDSDKADKLKQSLPPGQSIWKLNELVLEDSDTDEYHRV